MWNKRNRMSKTNTQFAWLADRFADVQVLRYQIDGYEQLTPKQRILTYYLSQAALCGRDITYDQNYADNLLIRRCLERIYITCIPQETEQWRALETYLKKLWFANGVHHHYSTAKFSADGLSATFLAPLLQRVATADEAQRVLRIIFTPSEAPLRVNQQAGVDMVTQSACNFYQNVSQAEVEAFYAAQQRPNNPQPISMGLNSRLVKLPNGQLQEQVWRIGGTYSTAIERITHWLSLATSVAENEHQRRVIETLIEFYRTGDLHKFDEYSILWVNDTESKVDFINGFIETYGDPMGYKATWESVVNFRDDEASRRTQLLAQHAQWFEDNSPIDPQFRKPHVTGISAKSITLVQLGGDCHPTSPLGINLPNADWIRQQHGSKSVSLNNIAHAHEQASLGSGFEEEFGFSPEHIARSQRYGALGGRLHTDLHECLGHGSGQLLPGVSATAMGEYSSTLEEARADLFGLYYIADPKLVELGILPDMEAYKAAYSSYIRNGIMVQFSRIEPGKKNTEAHMQNRKLIAEWCYEKGLPSNVIEKKVRQGKTYFVVNDFVALRSLFGTLLSEIQRIKSEGDYQAGKHLVETYAVNIDPDLHKEVLERYRALGLKPYGGFINPEIVPVVKDGRILDYELVQAEGYLEQQLDYGRRYRTL